MPFIPFLPVLGKCSFFPGILALPCAGGAGAVLGSYHVLNLLKAGEQQELGGSFLMFQTGFRSGSNWFGCFGKKSSCKSGTSKKDLGLLVNTQTTPSRRAPSWGLFPDFSRPLQAVTESNSDRWRPYLSGAPSSMARPEKVRKQLGVRRPDSISPRASCKMKAT